MTAVEVLSTAPMRSCLPLCTALPPRRRCDRNWEKTGIELLFGGGQRKHNSVLLRLLANVAAKKFGYIRETDERQTPL
jgi:hypothetical protein